ncbi:HAD-IA family hydrolase [Candidatus Woesearchaeota archaeon]|nr:HAD-IA family hydrolase [Candidatus Woesearchaeota archaeon]
MKVKTILFDLGGVFVSDAKINYKNHLCDFSSVLAFAGVSQKDADKVMNKHWPKLKLGEESLDDFWKDFQSLVKKGVDLKDVINMYWDRILMDEDVFEFARKLKKKYHLMALANESKEGMDFKNKKFKLLELFEKVYCSAYLHMAKPNKDIYEAVINDSKLDLSTTVFVDNQIANVNMAESLGIKSILFKNLEQLKEELTELGISTE